MSIVVQNNNGLLSRTANASTSIFVESVPNGAVFFTWVLGSTNLSPMEYLLKLPYYPAFSAHADLYDFNMELLIADGYNSNIEFFHINNATSVVTSVGEIVEENGITTFNKQLAFSFLNLNLLSPAVYYKQVHVKVYAYRNGVRELVSENVIGVSLKVTMSFEVLFEVESSINTLLQSYNVFYYKSTQNIVKPKGLYVFHNTPFSLDHPDFSVIITPYGYYSFIEFNLPTTFLDSLTEEENIIPFQFTHQGGVMDFQLRVIVYEDTEPTQFLTIIPDTISVDLYKNAANSSNTQTLTVMSGVYWEIISDIPEWLSLNRMNGSANSSLILNFDNYNHLTAGVYSTILVFETEIGLKTVPVTMILHDFVKFPFKSNQLFFTQNEDYMEFNDEEVDSYIDIEIEVKSYGLNIYDQQTKTLNYSMSLFRGEGKFHVGNIVHNYFKKAKQLTDFIGFYEGNYTKTQYAPCLVNVSYSLKNAVTNEELRHGEINNLLFVLGKSPYVTTTSLALLTANQQELQKITPNSNIVFSFIHRGVPSVKMFVNGIFKDVKNIIVFSSDVEKCIHTYCDFAPNFRLGDLVEFQIQSGTETRIKRYVVMHEGPSSVQCLFENQNGVLESFEFTGRYKISENKTHTTNKEMRGLKEITKKIHSENTDTIEIDCGHLISGDLPVISALIDSKNVWLAFNDNNSEWVQVDSVTTKSLVLDNFQNNTPIKIDFNILNTDTHARIYNR